MSDETPSAEPVDAEFEPAPGSTRRKPKTSPSKSGRAGLLTLIGVTLLAGTVAGGTGWLLGRYLPGPQTGPDPELLARIEALETANVEPALAALDTRMNTLEAEANAQTLRAQALEQLIRDVASLREQMAAIGSGSTGTASETVDLGPINTALSELDSQLTALDNRLSAELETIRTTARTTQSAVQQILSQGQTPEAPVMDLSALTQIQSELAAMTQTLTTLQDRVSGLEAAEPGSDSLDLAPLTDRVNALETRMTALQTDESPQISAGQVDVVQRALAFSELAEAAARSQPFAMEYAMLSQIWPDAPGLIDLRPAARDGAPTLSELAMSFPGDAVRQASGETRRWLGVIEVRRTGDDGGTATDIERLLSEGQLAAALDQVDTIQSEEARLALAVWIEGAQSRLVLDTLLDELRTALALAAEAEI